MERKAFYTVVLYLIEIMFSNILVISESIMCSSFGHLLYDFDCARFAMIENCSWIISNKTRLSIALDIH